MTDRQDPSLAAAYALKTPEDSVRLYRDWAADYDRGFAAETGYVYPAEIARVFAREAGAEAEVAAEGPVLDIGAGTGLVAEALGALLPGLEIDGIDISREMLAVAAAKGLYGARIEADLTAALPLADARYRGFVSAGTFTHGHVGPGCLAELLRVARPGALFVLGVKSDAFDKAGFGSAFAELVADRAISPIRFDRVPVYDGSDPAHRNEHGLVAVFRRAEGGR